MSTRHDAILVFALSLSAACGSVDAGPDPAGPDGGGADHRDDDGGQASAATVVSVSPADGAGGVAPDADITVVFSRAMDEASVEAAWSSELLPAGAVAFSWNPSGDTLTVTPDDPLPVAQGSGDDPDSVEAAAISFAIGDGARDAAGDPLAEPLQIEFRTVRRLTLEVPYNAPLSDCRYSDGSAVAGDEALFAGDDYQDQQIKMVVSFALPELPPGAVLDAATFLSDHRGIFGEDPYQGLGELRMSHVRFNTLATSFATAALGSQSLLSDDPKAGARSVPVTRAVADDYADDRPYAQFRAEFSTATDNDGDGEIAVFGRTDFALSLAYLVE